MRWRNTTEYLKPGATCSCGSWRALWKGIEAEASRRIRKPERLSGIDALGVDEHVWTHAGFPCTGISDHTRDEHGNVHARVLDLVPGRSGKAYGAWLKERGPDFAKGIKVATLDPVPRLCERYP